MKNSFDLLELIPRINVSSEILKHLRKLSENDFKIQKEGIESIEKIIQNNKNRISSEGLTEFFNIIKKNIKEKRNNKVLLRLYINLAVKIYEGTGGKDFPVNNILDAILFNLTDKQILVKSDIINCLEKFIKISGIEIVLNQTIVNFKKEKENIELKIELLKILIMFVNSINEKIFSFAAPCLLISLCDKNRDIRFLTGELLAKVFQRINCNEILENCMKSLNSVYLKEITIILEKFFHFY